MIIKNKNIIKELEYLLKDNTIIDAGHYSPILGPDKTDIYIWNIGVSLYKKAKEKKLKNIGLMLLVDDMYKFDGFSRKNINIHELPKEYNEIINKNKINKSEIIFISQNNLRNTSWLYVKRNKEKIIKSKKFTRILKDSKGSINQIFLKAGQISLPLLDSSPSLSGKPPAIKCNFIVASHIKNKEKKDF